MKKHEELLKRIAAAKRVAQELAQAGAKVSKVIHALHEAEGMVQARMKLLPREPLSGEQKL